MVELEPFRRKWPRPGRKVKVGLVSTFNEVFEGDKEDLLKRSIDDMEALSKEMAFDFQPIPRGLADAEDAEQARNTLVGYGIDLLLVQCTSFPDGNVILPLTKSGVFLGLWALPEPGEVGPLPLNSFCGMNMLSSIIGHFLGQLGIPYKWFYGATGHDLFRYRFEMTLAALRSLINLRGARILQVGHRAPGFHDLYFDERAFEKRFGCDIDVVDSIDEVIKRARQQPDGAVAEVSGRLQANARACHVAPEALERSARIYLALYEVAVESQCQAMAVSCWPKFQEEYGLVPCAAYSLLNEDGVVCACEGDVPGAISMLLLNYLHGGKATLMDVSDLDEEAQAILLFHCGVAPVSYADDRGVVLAPHSILGRRRADGKFERDLGTVADMVFQPGSLTATRVLGEADSVLVASGTIFSGRGAGFDGSRGWLTELSIKGKSVSVRDFANTLIVGRVPHHLAITYGDVSGPLQELAAWLQMETLDSIPYQPYLQR